jgi:hypothetical protein
MTNAAAEKGSRRGAGTKTIEIDYCTKPDELYKHWFGGESQPCLVSLDLRTGKLSAFAHDTRPPHDQDPDVAYGLVLEYQIPVLTADNVNALMDRTRPLAEQVLDGFSEEWNGNYTYGELTADAEAAAAEIAEMCRFEEVSREDIVVELCPWEFFEEEQGLSCLGRHVTAETTDAELREIAAEAVQAAEGGFGYGYVILDGGFDGALEYLIETRDELRPEEAES